MHLKQMLLLLLSLFLCRAWQSCIDYQQQNRLQENRLPS
jgi:hypothetical protein